MTQPALVTLLLVFSPKLRSRGFAVRARPAPASCCGGSMSSACCSSRRSRAARLRSLRQKIRARFVAVGRPRARARAACRRRGSYPPAITSAPEVGRAQQMTSPPGSDHRLARAHRRLDQQRSRCRACDGSGAIAPAGCAWSGAPSGSPSGGTRIGGGGRRRGRDRLGDLDRPERAASASAAAEGGIELRRASTPRRP